MTDKKKKPAKKIHPNNAAKAEKAPKAENAKKPTSRINLEKCREDIVDAHIAQFQLEPKDNTLAEKVRVLQAHQRKTPKKKLSTPCDVCGGESNMDLPVCPFCGTDEIIPPGEVAAAPAAADATGEVTAVAAIVVAVPGGEVLNGGGLADLEMNETAIRQADANGVGSYYDKGQALLNIYRHNLWKHRTGPDQKGVYKSWGEYIKVEHGMSSKHSMDILEVAETFDRDTFVEVGVSRLRQIMRYEGDDREKLLKMAKSGEATKAKLLEYVRDNPPPHRTNLVHAVAGESAGKAKGGFKGGAAAAQKGNAAVKAKAEAKARTKVDIKPSGEITAMMLLGNNKVKLFTKKDPTKRASTMAQEPQGTLVLPSGVELHFTLGRDSSGLNINMKVKRPDEKGAAA